MKKIGRVSMRNNRKIRRKKIIYLVVVFVLVFGGISILRLRNIPHKIYNQSQLNTMKDIWGQNDDLQENTKLKEQSYLNLENNILTGKQDIICSGNKLKFNRKSLVKQTKPSIGGVAQVLFDVQETNPFFKNVVAAENQVIGMFEEGTYKEWTTYVYDIQPQLFDNNTQMLTLEFHAGNKANTLQHNVENNDDFFIKNIRIRLPDGTISYPYYYEAKKGVGKKKHENLNQVERQFITPPRPQENIYMGDTKERIEILYTTFYIDEKYFDGVKYQLDTTSYKDGAYLLETDTIKRKVVIDNTPPTIQVNLNDWECYRSGVIEVKVQDNMNQDLITVEAYLDDEKITLPYSFRSLEMTPGYHVLKIIAIDGAALVSKKYVYFETPEESANIMGVMLPQEGSTIQDTPVFTLELEDPMGDSMQVEWKLGTKYILGDSNVQSKRGTAQVAGTTKQSPYVQKPSGYPFERYEIQLTADEVGNISQDTEVRIQWEGKCNYPKLFLYGYSTVDHTWKKLITSQVKKNENVYLEADFKCMEFLQNNSMKFMLQCGEGYNPPQYPKNSILNNEFQNIDDTKRSEYDFTFVWQSDPQYYNEDFTGNIEQLYNGKYQFQLDMNQWILDNRARMNIQYMFHTGDLVDDSHIEREWQQADAAFQLLDAGKLPYGVLAGNHDVSHLDENYNEFEKYFGYARYEDNSWYYGDDSDNKCHYDLISVEGIDFIMLYAGWGITEDEITWMNQVLAQYPERKAILNFHEYLLASGGLGEIAQLIQDKVIRTNDNVMLVLSGHYHNAKAEVEYYPKADGTTRKVYTLLFDYQNLQQGGMGYMRLMHFDTEKKKVIFRTYSPSLNDYDAKKSKYSNVGNKYVVQGAGLSIIGKESFQLSFEDLGIVPKEKVLETTQFGINFFGTEVIAQDLYVESGGIAQGIWEEANDGTYGWYAEVSDVYGGFSRTPVQYMVVKSEKND